MGQRARLYPLVKRELSDADLMLFFPQLLPGTFRRSSDPTDDYNCIAFAATENDRTTWWWPVPDVKGNFWPRGVPRNLSLDSFIEAFETLGYQTCSDATLEPGLQKVALYVSNNGRPTHAARQLPSGEWTSKLGRAQDIVHATPQSLEGAQYGTVAQVLKRSLP